MRQTHPMYHSLLQISHDGFIRFRAQIDQHSRHETIVHMILVADAHALLRHADPIAGDELS